MASGSVMASSINSLVLQGQTLVWHTGLPRGGEPRDSPPFSYGGREWCFRFVDDGWYHSIRLHRLDAGGKIEESDEELTHPFRVHCFMMHLRKCDTVVGDVKNWTVCGTSKWLWSSGVGSEQIFRRLHWLRDLPEVKFACRFPAPPTIPTDASIGTEGEAGAEGSDTSERRGGTRALEDFGKLLDSGEGSDVTVQVGDYEFQVHKFVLFARCPALSISLRHESVERASNRMVVEDCDPRVFRDFLHHLYTGSVGSLSERDAFGLFRIADRYLVEDLRRRCLERVGDTLSVETFCDVVELALTHGEGELLRRATEFAVRNIREIVRSVSWQNFLRQHPTEANEIFIQSLGPPCDCRKGRKRKIDEE